MHLYDFNKIKGVVSVAKTTWAKAYQVLFSEKEGNLRRGRRYQAISAIRTARLGMLPMQAENQSTPKVPELYGGYGRTYYSPGIGWYAHLEQRSASPR